MSPSDRVAQLYRQALGSLFVALYSSQGYGGGIQAHLHTGDYTHTAFLNEKTDFQKIFAVSLLLERIKK
jgi:hypothetical protein